MQRVYVASNLAQAQLIADLLTHHGLPARVLNTHAGSLSGEIPVWHAGPEVWVDDAADFRRARHLIASMEATPASDATRTCAACSEESPAGFELCWQCGGSLLVENGSAG
ncbi:MAG: DUF2007 domain-containing protein [Polyangiales bacterium]